MLMLGFFEGLYTIEVKNEDAKAVFACMLAHTVRAKKTWRTKTGRLRITLFSTDYKKMRAYAAAGECPMPHLIEVKGLPRLLTAIRKRPGIAVGAVFGALLLFFSSQIVWRVDVVCPDLVSAEEVDALDLTAVKERLTSQGVAAGLYLPDFDSRHAERQFLIDQSEVSWIAINRRGTVLSAEVRPSYAVKEDDRGFLISDEDGYYEGTMLIADSDGIIVRTELRNGTSQVVAEQMVTKGEVLATGVFESVDGDVRFSRVSGKVFAKTVRVLSYTVPLVKEEAVYSGESETARSLRLFGWELPLPRAVENADENVTFLQIFENLLTNSGFSASEYDIIEDENLLSLPDGTLLPISYVKAVKNGKKTQHVRVSKEEAITEAQRALSEMRDALTDAEIFGVERAIEQTEDAITVIWYVDCIDNIATSVPFSVEQDGELTPR